MDMSEATDPATVTTGAGETEGVRVVLVDARPERRAVMRTVIDQSKEAATVLGEADGQADAMAAVEKLGADLVVIDFQAPVQDGLDTVAALRGGFPALAILVSSFNDDVAVKQAALAAGADAYLPKPVTAKEVIDAMGGPRAGVMQPAASAS